ncbi:MAG TPA: WYL domain-containing protein, partial [Blastocatellia bacterium]|nr:WYL domain-containing protein [Blastocatellia bacterium]
MRADRLLSILLLLQVHRRITAGELARRLEVSERTIHRDMEALGTAGIPVVAERGIGGGWSLLGEYRTNLTGLNKAEIQALFLAGPSRLLADLGLEKASDAALIKLLAALPSTNRDDAEYIRQRIHIDISGWHRPDESIPFLPTIQEAIWRERKLLMTYNRGGGCDPVERLVDPLGLVAKGSVWYLVAAVDGDMRSYRMSRIRKASATSEVAIRPDGFDLEGYWRQSSAVFKNSLPRYHAVLRVAADVLPRLGYAGRFARIEHIGPPDRDGWSEVTMRFQFEH